MTSEKYLVSPLWVTTVPYTSWCPRVMVFLPDQTAVAVPHSTDLLSGSHLIHRTGGLLGYRLVISNRGINSVSDRITTIINRSALSVPFNFPQMIETRYCEAAFMFCDLVCLAENRSAALLRRENFVMIKQFAPLWYSLYKYLLMVPLRRQKKIDA